MFLEWSAKLWQVLKTLYPIPERFLAIPEDKLLPPRYLVALNTAPGIVRVNQLPPEGSLMCKIKQNRRMTAQGHWQDVRHIILESQNSALDYEAGDIAVVWPENPKEEVEIFLDTLRWTDIADNPLTIKTKLTGTFTQYNISDYRQTSSNSI